MIRHSRLLTSNAGAPLALAIWAAAAMGCAGPEPSLLDEDVGVALRESDKPFEQGSFVVGEPLPLNKIKTPKPAATVEATRKRIGAKNKVLIGLTQARKASLANNLGLIADRFDPGIARATYLGEKNGRFEDVFTAAPSLNTTKDAFGRELRTATIEPGVRVPFRNGSSVTIGLPFSFFDSHQKIAGRSVGDSWAAGANATLDVPILRGAGVEVNEAPIHQAGLRMRQAESRTKLSAIRLMANLERAYWAYYASVEQLKIRINQYDRSNEQLKMSEQLVAEGVRTEVEVIRAKSEVARRFETILRAETIRRRAERSLKVLINDPAYPVDSGALIVPVSQPLLSRYTFDRATAVMAAIKGRMELVENYAQEAIDDLSIKVTENAKLPDVRFNFSYGFNGAKPKLDKTFKQVGRDMLNTWTVGAAVELPLWGNPTAQGRYRAAILSRAKTLATRKVLEQSITQEVLDAIDAVELNWERILSNRIAVSLADATYKAEQTQFQDGNITSIEVLEALNSLADSESNLIQSYADYKSALVDLSFATGTVLEYGGVLWADQAMPE